MYETSIVSLDTTALDALSLAARSSPRLRSHRNLHPSHEDAVNRLAIAIEPGSYVRPHRHDERFELLLAVRGGIDLLTFDDAGTVTARHTLGEGGVAVVEMPAGCWHTLLARTSSAVFFEVKAGPYRPEGSRFAQWAPAEGAPGAQAMQAWFERARPGDRPPS